MKNMHEEFIFNDTCQSLIGLGLRSHSLCNMKLLLLDIQ